MQIAPFFQAVDLLALAVEQVAGDVVLHADLNAIDVLAVGGQLQHTHDVNAHALGGLDLAGAVAMRAVLVDAALERRTDALPGHLDQAELRDLENLRPRSIALDGVAQGALHVAAMAFLAHVDEIVDDHAAEVAQPQLAGDLLGSLQIHLEGGFLGVVVRAEVAAVHVDGHQRLRLVDDDRAAVGQRHVPQLNAGNLVFDPVTVEEGLGVHVVLDAVGVARHDDLQELLGMLERGRLIDPDRVDVVGEGVADGPRDHVAFLIDFRRPFELADAAHDYLPEARQIGEVALQLFLGLIDARGADDEAEPLGRLELVENLAQAAALLVVGDLARDADPVQAGHENQVAAGDTDIGA